MTTLQPAHYSQCGCHTAQGDRQVLSSLVCTEGVAMSIGGGLAVSPTGPPSMAVNVASGNAFIQGDNAAWQGMYHVSNDGTVTLTVDPADASDRIDIVIAEVQDSTYAGVSCDWRLRVVKGTPGGPPSPPALPINAIQLAHFTVTAGSVTVPAVTDDRTPYLGCQADSGWLTLTAAAGWQAASNLRYRKVDGRVTLTGNANKDAGSLVVDTLTTFATLPVGYRPSASESGPWACDVQTNVGADLGLGVVYVTAAGLVQGKVHMANVAILRFDLSFVP